MDKIKFKDLDTWLKVAVVISWVSGGLYALSFLLGMFAGSS